MAKNHVKGIVIVGVTQPEKKLTSSTLLEFPKEDKLGGAVLLGFAIKNDFTCPNGAFIEVSAKNRVCAGTGISLWIFRRGGGVEMQTPAGMSLP